MDCRGTIDEILGDGILAFFGAPEHLEDHPALGVSCALRMQNALEEVNKTHEEMGLPKLQMGIAINTGNVVVGNIGSERRTKYGAVGSQVNFTGRMESFTYGGQVLISESTYRRIADLLVINNVISVQMKGLPGDVHLYDVIGIKEPYNVYLSKSQEDLKVLARSIPIDVQAIEDKHLSGPILKGDILELSNSAAVVILKGKLEVWQDVRIQIAQDDTQLPILEIYGKVVKSTKKNSDFAVLLKFTLLSGDAQKFFEQFIS